MPDTAGRIVLVETSAVLPGLLPFQAWDALATADVVLARDPQQHPAAGLFHLAGLDLARLEPQALGREDLLLSRPGGPDERRLAKALVAAAQQDGAVVYLLDDDERGLAPALAGMVAEQGIEIELVFLTPLPAGTELIRAVGIMDRLRDPDGGCPWDLEQDHASLGRHLVEETYELLDAIDRAEDADIREELGDILLQVLFHARIAAERESFGIDAVARTLIDKLVHRHPHVFAPEDTTVADAADVQRNWDRLKAQEKGGERGPLDGIPATMPGLALLDALLRRIARMGLVPTDSAAILADVQATVRRLASEDGAGDDPEDSIGRLLLQVAGLSRSLGVEADAAARKAAGRLRTATEQAVAAADAQGLDIGELAAHQRTDVWPREPR